MTRSDHAGAEAVDPRGRLLDANRDYAEQFAGADAPKRPSERVFVLTCMDARIDPLRMLGLDLGAAHIMRNAGGRVSDDAMRSLVLSAVLLDTRHVMVIHHTDCGVGPTSDEQLREDLRARGVDVGNLWTGAFDDLEDGVRDDVQVLRSHPLIGDRVTVSGHVYDVATGQLRSIDGGPDADTGAVGDTSPTTDDADADSVGDAEGGADTDGEADAEGDAAADSGGDTGGGDSETG